MKKQDVDFKVGGEVLRGTLFIPDGNPPASQARALRAGGSFPGVIFFHGSGSRGSVYFKIAEEVASKGIIGFVFNFRGCGISDGDFSKQTVADGIEDARRGLEFFMQITKLDKKRLGILGASFGGFLASLLALEYNFKSIVLEAPAHYTQDVLKFTHQEIKQKHGEYVDNLAYKTIKDFNGSLLVIKNEFDVEVPPEVVEGYYEKAVKSNKKELFVLKGAEHRISINPQATKTIIEKSVKWFLETL